MPKPGNVGVDWTGNNFFKEKRASSDLPCCANLPDTVRELTEQFRCIVTKHIGLQVRPRDAALTRSLCVSRLPTSPRIQLLELIAQIKSTTCASTSYGD